MVRSTRSIVVTGIPISAEHPGLESAEKEISCRPIYRQLVHCISEGSMSMINTWAIAKVAGTDAKLCESCGLVMRLSSARSAMASSASESGGLRGIFAVQLHAMVRGYDARLCKRAVTR